jgi:hypothetical protein
MHYALLGHRGHGRAVAGRGTIIDSLDVRGGRAVEEEEQPASPPPPPRRLPPHLQLAAVRRAAAAAAAAGSGAAARVPTAASSSSARADKRGDDSDDSDDEPCYICLVAPPTVRLPGCNRALMCQDCYVAVQARFGVAGGNASCPLCRR